MTVKLEPHTLQTFTCKMCGFEFDYIADRKRRRTMCDECRREQRREWGRIANERRRAQADANRPPSYDMAKELARLRMVVEMIGPLMRTGQYEKALAFLYYGQAPTRL